MGEIDGMLFWNIVLSLIVIPFSWVFTYLVKEVKRQQILINKTREEIAYHYARKDDVRNDVNKLMDALHRLEDKLDKVLSK